MWELLWLLLPVAAASGWVAGRKSAGKQSLKAQGNLKQDYFRGLNYVLNDKPDKAIEVFIRMVEVDSETVETHAALGNLFRRRGEVDRAIRIHQNLIARPSLDKEQRSEALLELGEDYMKAGLFDRAENLFLERLELKPESTRALRSLVLIYEQERDWEKAIETARALKTDLAWSGSKRAALPLNQQIAQYYCEMAEESRKKDVLSRVKAVLKKAYGADPDCIRASMILGDIEFEQGRFNESIEHYQRVVRRDMAYMSEVVTRMHEAFVRSQREADFKAYLMELLPQCHDASPMLTLADGLLSEQGAEQAVEFVAGCLRDRPTVAGLKKLIDLKLPLSSGQPQQDLLMLQELLTQLVGDRASYQCGNCGFSGRSLHWQCPSCTSWNTIKPIPGMVSIESTPH